MEKNKNQRRLKNYLIRKDIQLKIILTNLLHMFFITLITIAVTLSPIVSIMYQSYSNDSQYQASKFFLIIAEKLPLTFGIVLMLAFIHQIVITHRICGPLINFVNTFKCISRGDFSRKIHLRPNDFLKEEGQHINQIIDEMSQRVGIIRQDFHRLLRSLNAATVKTNSADEQKQAAVALETAKKQAETIDKHLSVFKLAEKCCTPPIEDPDFQSGKGVAREEGSRSNQDKPEQSAPQG